jgi:protein SCO1
VKRPQLVLVLGLTVAVLIGGAVVVAGLLATGGNQRVAVLPPPGPYKGSEPPAGIRAPDFALRDYRGPLISMRAQRGKVVVISFVDSACTEKCPIVTGIMAQAYRLLRPSERRQVMPILLTVNPRVDKPANVRRFLVRRGALDVDYLIGKVSRLRPIWKAFHIVAAVDTGNVDIHSSDVRIFDRGGFWVSTQHAGIDLTPENLAHDIRVVLRAWK